MPDPKLVFLPNDAGEKEGLGDAGIETFRDAPYASCAREVGQNSLDAPTKQPGLEGRPVRLTFDVLRRPADDIPWHDDLCRAVEACRIQALQEPGGREADFFRIASEVARGGTLPILRISDENTTGLVGPPDVAGTPFHSLVKASGVTVKDNEDSGGSFGIGKNAAFAVSGLQTVFYSSLYLNGITGEEEFAAQGKAKLVSHTTDDGSKCRATGYWGNPQNFSAVTDPAQVPEWMQRENVGTSIFCLGFLGEEDWAERMVYSLISNFFCAIHRGRVEFSVDEGRFLINKGTLADLMENPDIQAAAENIGHLADLHFAHQLYRCLVSEKAEEIPLGHIPGLGETNMRILAEEGMPSRVGFIRNGMLITDNLRNFGQPLARFQGSLPFIALVEPADQGAGTLLKKLENPAHDGFSPERILDVAKRATAEKAMRELGHKIRKSIRESTSVRHEGPEVLDELAEYFSQTGNSDADPDEAGEDNPEVPKYEFEAKRRRRRTTRTRTGGGDGGRRTGGGGGGDGTGGGEGPGTGTGTGGRGSRGEREVVELADVRNRIAGTEERRELHFDSPVDGTIELTVHATGVNAPEELLITSARRAASGSNSLPIDESGILALEVQAGQRSNLEVSFSEPYSGPIELRAAQEVAVEEQS